MAYNRRMWKRSRGGLCVNARRCQIVDFLISKLINIIFLSITHLIRGRRNTSSSSTLLYSSSWHHPHLSLTYHSLYSPSTFSLAFLFIYIHPHSYPSLLQLHACHPPSSHVHTRIDLCFFCNRRYFQTAFNILNPYFIHLCHSAHPY